LAFAFRNKINMKYCRIMRSRGRKEGGRMREEAGEEVRKSGRLNVNVKIVWNAPT
jgi:hypothetical protein